MVEVILLVVAGYFALWIYACFLVIKFQKSLYKSFPDQANQILGTKNFFGINAKKDPFFLWREDIKELARRDESINALRRTTVKTIYLLCIALFLSLPFVFMIWLLFFRV
jgi:hypothetical protein